MKAKQAPVKPKPISQLEKHACCCPPTKHDTKLDQLNKAKEKQALFFFFFFFFLGYKIVVYSVQAKKPSGHQTNLRYAGTTAKSACNRRSVHCKKSL